MFFLFIFCFFFCVFRFGRSMLFESSVMESIFGMVMVSVEWLDDKISKKKIASIDNSCV